jgi:predicted nucleic acid-binding protein
MKTYWDSSALVAAVETPAMQLRLQRERGVTRSHALAEVFSTITGNPKNRADAQIAAEILASLAKSLDFVDLTADEMLAALKSARKLGVRGGRVHDFFHAVAAKKSGAKKIVTLDKNDFAGLTEITLEII